MPFKWTKDRPETKYVPNWPKKMEVFTHFFRENLAAIFYDGGIKKDKATKLRLIENVSLFFSRSIFHKISTDCQLVFSQNWAAILEMHSPYF